MDGRRQRYLWSDHVGLNIHYFQDKKATIKREQFKQVSCFYLSTMLNCGRVTLIKYLHSKTILNFFFINIISFVYNVQYQFLCPNDIIDLDFLSPRSYTTYTIYTSHNIHGNGSLHVEKK